MDVSKYLSGMVASIKRLGLILAGDEVGDGWSWQRCVARYQAHEMRHYAEVLDRVADGKHGGGVVFPSWDAGGDGVDSPVPPLEIKGVPTEKVADWVAGLRADCEQRGDLIMRQDDRIASLRKALAAAVQIIKDNDLDESLAGEFEVLTDALNGEVSPWKYAGDRIVNEFVPPPVSPDTVASLKAGVVKGFRAYSEAKAALAAAAVALLEGADTLARYGSETGKPMVCVAVEGRMRTVHGMVVATIEGRNEKPANPPCCICGKAIESEGDWHSGHNAEPVAKGRCCRACNDNVVVPARLREFMHRTAPKS